MYIIIIVLFIVIVTYIFKEISKPTMDFTKQKSAFPKSNTRYVNTQRSKANSNAELRRTKTVTLPIKIAIHKDIFKTFDEILSVNSVYYNALEKKHKVLFLKRVHVFIENTEFIPCLIPEVTTEMQVLIAGSAVQLTLGMGNFLSYHIKGVRVYPDVYYSKLMKAHLQGHYHPKGVIFLSYKHFIAGYKTADDGRNLGLHEMTHALHFALKKELEYTLFIENVVLNWMIEASKEQKTTNTQYPHVFLRDYAFTNVHEFFAVCVENYFERPKELHNRLPIVYKHLSFLLNQNPLQIPLYETKPVLPALSKAPFFRENENITMTIIAFLFFLLCGIVLWQYSRNNVTDIGNLWPFIAIPGILFFVKIITKKEILFYEDFICIRHILMQKDIAIISRDSLLYVSIYMKKEFNSSNKVISFIWHSGKLKESLDILRDSEELKNNIRAYCKKYNILLIEKA